VANKRCTAKYEAGHGAAAPRQAVGAKCLVTAALSLLVGCTTYSLHDATTANARLDYLPWRQTPSTQNEAVAADTFRVEPGMRLVFVQAPVDDLQWNISTAPLSISYWEVPESSSLDATDYAVMGWMLESAFPLPLADGSNPRFDPLAAVINKGHPSFKDVLATMRVTFSHVGNGEVSGKAWDAAEMRDTLCTARAGDYRQADARPPGVPNPSHETQLPNSGTPKAPGLYFEVPMGGLSRGMQLGGASGWYFENPKTLHYDASVVGSEYYQPSGIDIIRLRMAVAANIRVDVKGQPARFVSPCATVSDLETNQGLVVEDILRLKRFLPDIQSSKGLSIPANTQAAQTIAVSNDGRFDIAFDKAPNVRFEFPAPPYMLNAFDDQKCGMLLAPGDIVIARPVPNYEGICPRKP
jgi:hypothetical protein